MVTIKIRKAPYDLEILPSKGLVHRIKIRAGKSSSRITVMDRVSKKSPGI